jgi:hypothetical protein
MKPATRASFVGLVCGGLACGLLCVSATASTSYVCVVDMATGFAFNKSHKQWECMHFNADTKYLLSQSTEEKYAWVVKEVGSRSTIPEAVCVDDFNDVGHLFCEGLLSEFRINKKNLRFLLVYPVGYWNDNREGMTTELRPEGTDTPYMAIGKCSLLDVPP